ncbi:PAAR domain-containing protein [Massilia forsythiae]|uniref:PAAR domain-containing protein n=1 Tax=Massilia forsythiae TaxID=2728020 RepID=A0A7Z2VZ36_9BURK|nr:PAAR domain-containing protein [Massilia forsythiae]QJE02078.1 PAAR domain-containing protein [Massilia forsythiae]
MGERAIIRQGDRTSHGGTVVEGHPFLLIYGKPAAGAGHKVHCPRCPGNVVIVEGAVNATMMGVRVAVEGMKTSCGATLIASQITATIECGSGFTTAPSTAAPVASAATKVDPSVKTLSRLV